MREAEYYLFTYTYSAVGRRIEMGARERRSQQRKEIFRDSFFSCTCFGGGLRRRILWIKSCFAHILFFSFVCCVWCLWSARITRNADGVDAAHGRQAGRLQRRSLESRLVIIWRTTGNTIFESVPSSSSSCKCVGAKANAGKFSRNRSTPRRRMCALSRILYSKFERSAHTHTHTRTQLSYTGIPSLGNAFCFRFHLNYFASFISTYGVVFGDCVVVALFRSSARRMQYIIFLCLSVFLNLGFCGGCEHARERWLAVAIAYGIFQLFVFRAFGAMTMRNRIEY